MSNVVGSALGSATPRGCSGTAEGTKAVDRVVLEQAIEWLDNRFDTDDGRVAVLIAAACAHLATLPKTKMIEVWHVEYSARPNGGWQPEIEIRDSEREAGHRAARLREMPNECTCIKVTGPHKREVPA